jgi:sulfur carrier protein
MIVLVNGETQDLSAGATLASVVESLHGRSDGRGVAIALDGEVVPRAAWEETRLSDGARIEIVVAVQGG